MKQQAVNALTTAGAVFAAIAGSGLAGLLLGRRLPGHHLDRDAVRLVAGFDAALAALVLGLLVASAKANFDERNSQRHHTAADVIALDRALLRYGDGAQEARPVLRAVLADEFNRLSANNRLLGTGVELSARDARLLGFHDRIQALAPHAVNAPGRELTRSHCLLSRAPSRRSVGQAKEMLM